jgi:hypothetical protein
MDSGRRQLLLQALGAVGAIAFPNGASAQRRRVLGEASDIRQSPPGGKPDGDLSSWLLSMRVGPAAAHASLLAFWLAAKDEPSKFDITTLDEARRSGTLLITERAQATVPELIVDNRGKVPVLLLAGEILVGGKQNRILIEDVLLPPLSGVRPLGVYCVEQGRWNDGSREFSSKGSFAQPRLRSKLLEGAGQRQVWDSVAQASREYLASPAPTQSYQAIYDDQRIRAHADEVERTAQLRLPAGVYGAAVFVGGRFSGLDLFDFSRPLRARVAKAPARARARGLSRQRSRGVRERAPRPGARAPRPGRASRGRLPRECRRGSALRVPAAGGARHRAALRGPRDPRRHPLMPG